MTLQLLAPSFLLVFVSLLAAQGQEEPDPKVQAEPSETETCQRPWWDSRLRLAPDKENYKKDEEVMLSCPEGFQPSFTHIKCSSEVHSISHGKPVYREVWRRRDSSGRWIRIQSDVRCMEVLQVLPGTLEISSTTIKLNWTCRLPDTCQRMRATCRLAGPSSPPCEAEEVKGEEMLHGQEGTFTCPPLQPFTVYSVTISLPPSTVLFTWLVRTKETVPDKPEKLWLDPSTGSLRWQALPSCKGEIIGYQLNITTRSTRDGRFLEMERLRLSGSVTEHPLPEHSPGSSYVVAMQGLTAAGAGAASLWEFQTKSSDTPHPLNPSCRSVRDISPSQGTAVLPLHPIARPSQEAREHQLIVAATHNGTAVEGACLGDPQSFNASLQPDTYTAAVLNLTAPTDFVLGDGTRGQGYHNAALQPGSNYTALLRLVRRSQQFQGSLRAHGVGLWLVFLCCWCSSSFLQGSCGSCFPGEGSLSPAMPRRLIKKVKVARMEISHCSPCPGPQETFRAVKEWRRWGG
ncbi:uncharacterized protein LOC142050284 isoform X1 [Phalacrocorax aristotelis]|uniref:uncharacterized protein LOC142050284 isoform X1 n=1 Tax=Phalacrocorax aristotelis TaxID=126867 RepID=UPI003F4C14D4